MKLPLRYYGDPILRQKCLPIEEITAEIRQLAADMIESMYAYEGIGVAAPQLGHLVRMFVSIFDSPDPYAEYVDPIVYINPVISNVSQASTDMNEACLSLPTMRAGPVPRPFSCTIEALDIEGKPFKKECTNFMARHVLHEVDHLNGVLYVDRIKGKQRTLLDPELRKIKQNYRKR